MPTTIPLWGTSHPPLVAQVLADQTALLQEHLDVCA
jgi:hypothetical protein